MVYNGKPENNMGLVWNHEPLKIEGKTSTIVWKTHFDTLLFNENLQV